MPNYVIEREIPGASKWTEKEVREISRRSLEVLQHLGVQWMHSYVTDDKVYCIYWAPGEEVIREHAQTLGVPANRISAVKRLMGPQTTE
jgi:hypothetical protein